MKLRYMLAKGLLTRAQWSKLPSGSHADDGDMVMTRDGRLAVVTNVEWIQTVFGSMRNCGRCSLLFPDGSVDRVHVRDFKIYRDCRRDARY